MSLVLPVDPSQLATGFCPDSYQTLLNAFSAAQTVTFPDSFTGITVSAAKPTDTTKAWLQLDSFGRPVRLYYFAQGAWLSLHPMQPGETVWWFRALPNFSTFDGGDANATSDISGPMWQQATDTAGNVIAAKFPLVAGTLPSGKVLAVGDSGGNESHILTVSEGAMDPNHQHTTGKLNRDGGDIAGWMLLGDSTKDGSSKSFGSRGELSARQLSALNAEVLVTSGVNSSTTNQAIDMMPPYAVGFLISRTSRLFYAL